MAEQQITAAPSIPVTDVGRFSDWIQAHRRTVLGAAVVVALLLGAVWFVFESGRRKEAFAADALDRARTAVDAGNYPEASSELQKLTQSYQGTDAAWEASLLLNQVRMMSGQSALAVDELRKLIAAKPPAFYLSAAQSHLGAALENTGKPLEAAQAYQQSAETAEEVYRKVDAWLRAARAFHASGKDKEAIDILSSVVKKYPDAPGTVEAQVRLAELTRGAS